jgi:hypothetical protein
MSANRSLILTRRCPVSAAVRNGRVRLPVPALTSQTVVAPTSALARPEGLAWSGGTRQRSAYGGLVRYVFHGACKTGSFARSLHYGRIYGGPGNAYLTNPTLSGISWFALQIQVILRPLVARSVAS